MQIENKSKLEDLQKEGLQQLTENDTLHVVGGISVTTGRCTKVVGAYIDTTGTGGA